jgi:putative transposase
MQIPRSTYYYRPTAQASALGDDRLVELIGEIQNEFEGYGYRRVAHELRRRGHAVNHKRVARVMRTQGLGIKQRRRFVRTTDSDHDQPIFPNLYGNIIPHSTDRVWVADITYIRLETGFCYLAVILDACSRKVVGYAISRHIEHATHAGGPESRCAGTKSDARVHSSQRPRRPICQPGIPSSTCAVGPARLNEFGGQSVPQRSSGELYEDHQGGAGPPGRLRTLQRCHKPVAKVHRRGLQR